MEIKNILIGLMKKSFNNDSIDHNSNNNNTENWDSINFLMLIVNIEEEFKISFNPEELVELNSFELIFKAVKLKKSN